MLVILPAGTPRPHSSGIQYCYTVDASSLYSYKGWRYQLSFFNYLVIVPTPMYEMILPERAVRTVQETRCRLSQTGIYELVKRHLMLALRTIEGFRS